MRGNVSLYTQKRARSKPRSVLGAPVTENSTRAPLQKFGDKFTPAKLSIMGTIALSTAPIPAATVVALWAASAPLISKSCETACLTAFMNSSWDSVTRFNLTERLDFPDSSTNSCSAPSNVQYAPSAQEEMHTSIKKVDPSRAALRHLNRFQPLEKAAAI